MSADSGTLVVGAVAYSPKAVTIWEGIRDCFRDAPAGMDYVLFSNYDAQVDALLAGVVDIAWNTNVAWVRTVRLSGGRCRALAMRDSDVNYTTLLVSRRADGPRTIAELPGRRMALGSQDSAQAAILPPYFLCQAGIPIDTIEVIRFDSDVGKHGDTGASELEGLLAVRSAVADTAAVGISTWEAVKADYEDLTPIWTSPPYSHCNFTTLAPAGDARHQAWVGHLMAMSWDVPEHRRIFELEGLTRWVEPHLAGYEPLFEALTPAARPGG
jgi:ABC-type phosphate/phosphonate transport system substrate-binding protein